MRGAYGWSLDGLDWNLETGPISSNASAWDIDLRFLIELLNVEKF